VIDSRLDETEDQESEDDYRFQEQGLESKDEDLRRWAIIEVSRKKMRQFEDALLGLLGSEPSVSNRRHLVRGLANIGTAKSAPVLLRVLDNEFGLILGDVAEAVAKLGMKEAVPMLEQLTNCGIDFVENRAKHAIKKLS
jgi:HEAT repeat protein